MGGSGGFRFLWLLGGELDELEEDELDELDELERVLGWQGCFNKHLLIRRVLRQITLPTKF